MEHKYLLLKPQSFYMLDNKDICIYLADNTLICPDFTMELLDESGFEEHRMNYDHANREVTSTCRKYNTILIIHLV